MIGCPRLCNTKHTKTYDRVVFSSGKREHKATKHTAAKCVFLEFVDRGDDMRLYCCILVRIFFCETAAQYNVWGKYEFSSAVSQLQQRFKSMTLQLQTHLPKRLLPALHTLMKTQASGLCVCRCIISVSIAANWRSSILESVYPRIHLESRFQLDSSSCFRLKVGGAARRKAEHVWGRSLESITWWDNFKSGCFLIKQTCAWLF